MFKDEKRGFINALHSRYANPTPPIRMTTWSYNNTVVHRCLLFFILITLALVNVHLIYILIRELLAYKFTDRASCMMAAISNASIIIIFTSILSKNTRELALPYIMIVVYLLVYLVDVWYNAETRGTTLSFCTFALAVTLFLPFYRIVCALNRMKKTYTIPTSGIAALSFVCLWANCVLYELGNNQFIYTTWGDYFIDAYNTQIIIMILSIGDSMILPWLKERNLVDYEFGSDIHRAAGDTQ